MVGCAVVARKWFARTVAFLSQQIEEREVVVGTDAVTQLFEQFDDGQSLLRGPVCSGALCCVCQIVGKFRNYAIQIIRLSAFLKAV